MATQLASTISSITITGGNQVNAIVGPNVDSTWTITGANAVAAQARGCPDHVLVDPGRDRGTRRNTLVGPNVDTTWNLTGANLGTFTATGSPQMSFSVIQNIVGGTAKDALLLDPLGSLTGTFAGGADSVDSISFGAGFNAINYADVVETLANDGTGTVSGKIGAAALLPLISYSGVELINDSLQAANRSFVFGNTNDGVRFTQSGHVGKFWVQPLPGSTFAAVEASNPTTALSVTTDGGDDTIMIDSFAPAFPATVTIDAGANNDAIVLALPNALAGNVTVDGGVGVDSLDDFTLVAANHVSGIEITPTGLPTYDEQGPAPITATGLSGTIAPYTGAVQSIAVNPANDQMIFIGTVNGGIWLTTDGGLTWTPKTDRLPSLSIGSITIAPRDNEGHVVTALTPRSKLVIYAGTGAFSSFHNAGGLSVGVLRSMDGGETWSVLAPLTLSGIKITSIVALDDGTGAVNQDPNAQIVLVAGIKDQKDGGVFRSTNSGVSFSKEAGDSATDLVADPGKPGRLYAAFIDVGLLAKAGVYRSDDYGDSWTQINSGLVLTGDGIDNDGNGTIDDGTETGAKAKRIVLAVAPNAGSTTNPVYAALLGGSTWLMGVFVSTPNLVGNGQSDWALLGTAGVVAPPPASAALKAGYGTVTFGDGGNTIISRVTGDWRADGFTVGQSVTVEGAADARNNGTWTIVSVTDKLLTVAATANLLYKATAERTTLSITARSDIPLDTSNQQPQVNRGRQGNSHFAMTADAAGNVYIAGDTGPVVAGNIYMFTPKNPDGSVSNHWRGFVDQTNAANVTRAHPDARDLVLDSAGRAGANGGGVGHLFNAADGGIYSLNLAPAGVWASLNGTGLGLTEVLSAAYDPLNDLVFEGAQDTGLATQTVGASDGLDNNGNGLADEPAESLPWSFLPSGDGNTVLAVPIVVGGVVVRVVHWVMGNNLATLKALTYDQTGVLPASGSLPAFGNAGLTVTIGADNQTFTAAGHGLSTNDAWFLLRSTGNLPGGVSADDSYYVEKIDDNTFRLHASGGALLNVTSAGTGTLRLVKRFSGLTNYDKGRFTSGYQPNIQYTVDAADPTKLFLALGYIYYSTDNFETVTQYGYLNNKTAFTAIVAGGTLVNTPSALPMYAAWGNNVVVELPTGVGNATTITTEVIAGAARINDLVLDSRNYNVAYAVTDAGVYKRVAANDWQLISQKLLNVGLDTIEFVSKADLQYPAGTLPADEHDVLLVGGSLGVFRAFDPAPNVVWTELGLNLPNAPVTDLKFIRIDPAAFAAGRRPIASDDILLVGTLGRGTWTLSAADVALAQSPVLTLTGGPGADAVVIARNAANAGYLDITLNGRTWSAPILTISRIVFNGNGGTDSLIMDSTNGAISIPEGIFFTGGTEVDTLTLEGSKVHGVVVSAGTTAPRTYTIDDVQGGGTELITFVDYVDGTDIATNNLPLASNWEIFVDAIARWWRGFRNPADTQLAVLARLSRG